MGDMTLRPDTSDLYSWKVRTLSSSKAIQYWRFIMVYCGCGRGRDRGPTGNHSGAAG